METTHRTTIIKFENYSQIWNKICRMEIIRNALLQSVLLFFTENLKFSSQQSQRLKPFNSHFLHSDYKIEMHFVQFSFNINLHSWLGLPYMWFGHDIKKFVWKFCCGLRLLVQCEWDHRCCRMLRSVEWFSLVIDVLDHPIVPIVKDQACPLNMGQTGCP
jgi:hypothetical protein